MRILLKINIAVKVLLLAFLLHAVVFSDLAQYQGKGMGWRLVLYPLTAAIVPVVWLLRGRRPRPYPHHIDIVVALPFLLDTAGNTFNLFDTITWWDDFMHALNWIPWVMVAGFVARYRPLGRVNVALLAWATARSPTSCGRRASTSRSCRPTRTSRPARIATPWAI